MIQLKYEREIESLKYKIADHEKTIIKFRGLVQQQQSEKDELSKRMQIKIDELQSKISNFAASNAASSSPGNFDFKQKLVESKNFAKVNLKKIFPHYPKIQKLINLLKIIFLQFQLVENELNKIEETFSIKYI